MYTVYILRTSKDTLYTGISNNLEKRLNEHKTHSKKSAKYMRSFESFELVYTEKHSTKGEALKREAEIKKLTRKEKNSLINI
jgi:putative endonuclease